MEEFVELQKLALSGAEGTKANSENSWSVDVKKIDQKTFDLSVKNPNKKEESILREPREILEEMKNLDSESKKILDNINQFL